MGASGQNEAGEGSRMGHESLGRMNFGEVGQESLGRMHFGRVGHESLGRMQFGGGGGAKDGPCPLCPATGPRQSSFPQA